MHLGLPDASGRQSVEPIEGSHFTVPADLVIKALGFDPEDLPAMFGEPELEVTRWGTLRIDHRSFMTSLPGVFAAGDIVRGASLVVWAIRDGRDAAAQIARPASKARRAARAAVPRSDGHDRWTSTRLRRRLAARTPQRLRHTYDPSQEHDACGVGLVAALDGKPRRDVVEAGIDALKAVWHRGAVDADGKTGDGAGIHVEIPQDFFADAVAARRRTSCARADRGRPGVPAARPISARRSAAGRSSRPRSCASATRSMAGARCRSTSTCIGEKANATRPEIEQIMIWNAQGRRPRRAFERDLYVIRRRIEKQAIAAQIPELYFCSLSSRSIIYKGMFLAEQLSEFYPDLLDERFVSPLRDLSPALFDQHLPDLAAGAAVPHARA